MIEKNKIFDALLNGREVNINSETKKQILDRRNDIMLCREFGWSQQDILNTSEDFYKDCILILQKENTLKQKKFKG